MDEYTNELVIRKKKYAYIYLIIVFVASVVCSNLYFSSFEVMGSDGISGEIVDSGEHLKNEIYVDSSKNIYENLENDIKDYINSGEIISNEVSVNVVSGEIEDVKEDEDIKQDDEEVNQDIINDDKLDYYGTNRTLDPNKPMVALTFDDGPDPKRTVKLLEILKKHNAVATFFDIGNLMEKYPEIVRQEIEAGCDVGGHTYSHVNLNSLSQTEAKEEIIKVENAFKNATGLELKYIRPTYGNANSSIRKVIDRPIINWSIDSLDWKHRNADKVIEEIRKTKNFDGKIILMHVIYDSTLEAVDKLIPQLVSEGYQIVTVSEMAEYKGYELENGKIYYQF